MEIRSAATLLRFVRAVCAVDHDRRVCAERNLEVAARWAGSLPWVHRTGRDVRWSQLFAERRISPSPVTAHELADGRVSSVYFFLGACAFPKGSIVLLFRPDLADLHARATFTPFDTGSLARFVSLTDHPACADLEPWTTTEHHCRCLQKYAGSARDLGAFVPSFLSAHFRETTAYVTRAQESEPDFTVFHGLRSSSGDRRIWTIEIQVHGDEGIPIDDEHLSDLLVRGKDRWLALPADARAMSCLLDDDEDGDSDGDPLAALCARRILSRLPEARP